MVMAAVIANESQSLYSTMMPPATSIVVTSWSSRSWLPSPPSTSPLPPRRRRRRCDGVQYPIGVGLVLVARHPRADDTFFVRKRKKKNEYNMCDNANF
jgi:hypothetical protein